MKPATISGSSHTEHLVRDGAATIGLGFKEQHIKGKGKAREENEDISSSATYSSPPWSTLSPPPSLVSPSTTIPPTHPLASMPSISTMKTPPATPTINDLPEELLERILELCVASPPFMPARPEWHQYSQAGLREGRGVEVKEKEKDREGAAIGGSLPARSKTMPTIPISPQPSTPTTSTTMRPTSPVIRTRLAPLLVNKRFNRIGTPLFYGTVLVRSEAQAKALGNVLWASSSANTIGPSPIVPKTFNKDLGRFIQTLILAGSWEEEAGYVVGACVEYGSLRRLDLTVTNSPATPAAGISKKSDQQDAWAFASLRQANPLLDVLPKLSSVKHLTLRKGGGTTYLTQKRVGDVVRSVARGIRSWKELETVYVAFKMSDDSLGTTAAPSGALTAAALPPPAPVVASVPPTSPRPNAIIPSGRGQGQRSNSTPSRYTGVGSGRVLPMIRTTDAQSSSASSSLLSLASQAMSTPSPCTTTAGPMKTTVSVIMEGETMAPSPSPFGTSAFPIRNESALDSPTSPGLSEMGNRTEQLLMELPRELDTAGPCTVLAWALANCVSNKLHTVATHTPSVWNGVLVRIVEGRERYLASLQQGDIELDGSVVEGGWKRVVLVDQGMFGGMDDFDLLGKAFGAGGDVSDEEEEVEGECVGFGKDTFAMPSPGIRSPWGFMSPTPNSPMMPISPMTPMSPMMSGWPATPRTPGFGGAGGRGGLFRHGAKDHPKLAGLIRKGDLAMSRLGARRDGAGVAGATMRGCDSPGRGPPVYMQSGGGLNISMRTRAYTMGSTSSGVSG